MLNKSKYVLFSIIPLLVLFLSLEVAQRIRYSVRYNDYKWLLYGYRFQVQPVDKGIKIEKLSSKLAIEEAFSLLSIPPNTKTDRYKFIFCIGGSSTAGVFNDKYHKYPYLLNRLIGPDYIVINLGSSSRISDDYPAIIRELLLSKISPELGIFYCGYNDIFIKDVNKIYATFCNQLLNTHHIMLRYSLLISTLTEKYIIYSRNQAKNYKSDLKRYERLEKEFYKNIEECVSLLNAHKIKVVLIPEILMAKNFGTITTNYENYAEKYINIPNMLKEISAKYNCEFINLQDSFNNTDFKRYFFDTVHLTDEGNKTLSKLIFQNSRYIKELINNKE